MPEPRLLSHLEGQIPIVQDRLGIAQQGLETLGNKLIDADPAELIDALETLADQMNYCWAYADMFALFDRSVDEKFASGLSELQSDFETIQHYVTGKFAKPDRLDIRFWRWFQRQSEFDTGQINFEAPETRARLLALSEQEKEMIRSGPLRLSKTIREFIPQATASLANPPAPPKWDQTVSEVFALLHEWSDEFGILGEFINRMLSENRIFIDENLTTAFSFSVAPSHGQLPLIYVPFVQDYRCLVQTFHQIGHSFHRYEAQKTMPALSFLDANIDEIIPFLVERRAQDLLAHRWPQAAECQAMRRQSELQSGLSGFEMQTGYFDDVLSGNAPDGGVPRGLSSYGLGVLLGQMVWDKFGWDDMAVLELARRADRLNPEDIFEFGS